MRRSARRRRRNWRSYGSRESETEADEAPAGGVAGRGGDVVRGVDASADNPAREAALPGVRQGIQLARPGGPGKERTGALIKRP